MLVVFGLGNPGSAYEATGHNVGFMVVDKLAQRIGASPFKRTRYQSVAASGRIAGCDVVIVKPQTFMNLSGAAASGASRYLGVGPESMIVVYDDMDLEVGKIRIRGKGSAGGHNGMKSIIEQVGSLDIARVRVGIGRPAPWLDSVDHVLGAFSRDELPLMSDAILSAADAILCIAEEGIDIAQTRFNSR